jgi:GNAT superfamily N-acetyltransferase
MSLSERTRHGVARYGLVGAIWRAAMIAGRTACRAPYLCESHAWYRLDLTSERPRIPLPTGLELIKAGENELPLLEQLETVGPFEARRRLAAGAECWVVLEGRRVVFSCWIFHGRMPVFAARGGSLDLPSGVVGLEDSIKSPAYRGRAIASGAWSAIADVLSGEGAAAILTKVEESNRTCMRSLEKTGFRPAASMRLVRVWLRPRVEIRLQDGDKASVFLAEGLAR